MMSPVNYIAQRGNSFNTENHCIWNLATGSQNDKNTSKLLVKFLCSGNKYRKFFINWTSHELNIFVQNSWK